MVFFQNLFFFTQYEKTFYGEQSMFMGERFPSFFFFLTCHGKDILELKQAMFNLATSFHMKSRGPSGWKKKMKQKKKRKHLRRKKIYPGGSSQFLILSKIQEDGNTASTAFVGKKQQI